MSTNKEDNKEALLNDKELDSASGGFFPYGLAVKEEKEKTYKEIHVHPSDRQAISVKSGYCPQCREKLDHFKSTNSSICESSGTCHYCEIKWVFTLW